MILNHRKNQPIILVSFMLASIATGGLLLLSTSASAGYASTNNCNNNNLMQDMVNTTLFIPNQIAAGGPIPL